MLGGALLIVSLFASLDAQAAACCGAGGIAPQIVTNDNRAQVQVQQSYAATVGDARISGALTTRSGALQDPQWITSISGAWAIPQLWDDRLQLHAAAPVVVSGSGARIGDVRAGASVELIRNWSYSAWRPELFAYGTVQAPTGASVYDVGASVASTSLVAGTGFWRASAGVLASKTWGDWDVAVAPELSYAFTRALTDSAGEPLTVVPGFGWGALASAGWSPGFIAGGSVRLGVHTSYSWRAGRETWQAGIGGVWEGSRAYASSALEWGVDLAWLVASDWSVSASYSDQSWPAIASNTPLSRSIGIQIQKRWLR